MSKMQLCESGVVHVLKCLNVYYPSVADGQKFAEVRINDRGYQVGDYVVQREFDKTTRVYSGRACLSRITYLADLDAIGWKGYVLFHFVLVTSLEGFDCEVEEEDD